MTRKYLIYTEGFSEWNFARSFLYSRGINFTEDIHEIMSETNCFLKNCRSDSNIYPSLKRDSWWINEINVDTLIVIISDINEKNHYTPLL